MEKQQAGSKAYVAEQDAVGVDSGKIVSDYIVYTMFVRREADMEQTEAQQA